MLQTLFIHIHKISAAEVSTINQHGQHASAVSPSSSSGDISTMSPTSSGEFSTIMSPSSTPTMVAACEDSPIGWYDSDGPDYDCNYYAQGDNCAMYGNQYENMGKTANQACCVCGGGVKTGTMSPSSSPTMVPSDS